MFFEYKVLIVYREFTKEYIKQEFKIFAKDEDNAKKIAKEILYLRGGNPIEDLQFVVKLVSPIREIQTKVQQHVKPLYNKLKDMFKEKDYNDFISMYIDLSGYAAKFDRKHKIKEYICRYEEIEVRVRYDFDNNICVLDKDYIIVNSLGSTYFVTNNMETILNCKA